MKFKIIVLFAMSFLVSLGSSAQCAMCRASVENNVSNGDASIGAGLNNGILYLVVMPYLMAGIIGYLWYRASKKKKARLQPR
jgi:preprotein translocase subunit SecY